MSSFGREIDIQSHAALFLSSAMRLQLSRLVNYSCTEPHEYPVMFGSAAVELTEYSSMASAQQDVCTDALSSRISLRLFRYFISVGKIAGGWSTNICFNKLFQMVCYIETCTLLIISTRSWEVIIGKDI